MEYVEGHSLRALRYADGPLPVDRAVDIAVQLLDALAAAHKRGIVHRDIKPGNLLLTDDDRVKLADFGIATMADAGDLTRTGVVLGTPQYLSPEQAAGARATPRSDLYAVGILLRDPVPPTTAPTVVTRSVVAPTDKTAEKDVEKAAKDARRAAEKAAKESRRSTKP